MAPTLIFCGLILAIEDYFVVNLLLLLLDSFSGWYLDLYVELVVVWNIFLIDVYTFGVIVVV